MWPVHRFILPRLFPASHTKSSATQSQSFSLATAAELDADVDQRHGSDDSSAELRDHDADASAVSSGAPWWKRLVGRIEVNYRSEAYFRTFTSLLLLSYSRITQVVFEYLQCVQVADTSVVQAYPEIDCNSSKYMKWRAVIILLLVFFVIGLPIYLAIVLLRNYSSIRKCYSADGTLDVSSNAFHRLGILFEPFDSYVPWWHAVILCRRMLTLAVLVFASPTDVGLRYALIGSLHCTSVVLNAICRPYRSALNNSMEMLLLSAIAVISFAVLADPTAPYSSGQQLALTLLVLFFGVGSMVFVAIRIWRSSDVLQGFKTSVGTFFKNARNRFPKSGGKIASLEQAPARRSDADMDLSVPLLPIGRFARILFAVML